MNLNQKQIGFLIAKSGDNDGWLPLWIHAEDTAGVIKCLLNTQHSSLDNVCGMDFCSLRKVAVLLAYLHDIGKMTPLFQWNILRAFSDDVRRSSLKNMGIDEHLDCAKKIHHSKSGETILLCLGFPDDLASIVGAHHGMPAGNNEIAGSWEDCDSPRVFFGEQSEGKRSFWKELYSQWCEYALEKSGFSDIDEIPKLNKRTQVLLSALLIEADWIASDQTKFELLDTEQYLPFGSYDASRIEKGMGILDLPEVWEPFQEIISDDDFSDRFSFSMNEIQKVITRAAENCNNPGLFILEAPMGMGKTEAALSAAEILAAKCCKSGVFFGLPTQATANGIFERIVSWVDFLCEQSALPFDDDGLSLSINLSHGNADFMPLYEKIKNESVFINDSDNAANDKFSGVTVHSFFSGAKKALLSNFVVGTVDRLLMAALKKKHAMLLHLGLSEKVVIIDECHAYDAYMNKYLERALTWLHEYNVPVILLSATLPSDRRIKLAEAYLNVKRGTLSTDDVAYPRLTYTDGGEVKSIAIDADMPDKAVRIVRGIDDECVAEQVKRAVESGACVGVICNTVLRAQKFCDMAQSCEGANVILYHAQFTVTDRAEKEDALKQAIGKQSDSSKRAGTIVVGTQVLEQSLDIDFDILITDLCPMDLLLQRIGRLHRHKRIRPKGYEDAVCVVLQTDEINEASIHIYTKWLLLKTLRLLPETVNIPSDIDNLVSDTYLYCEPYNGDEEAAYSEYERLISDKESKATSGYLIEKPKDNRYANTLHGMLSNGVGDSDKKGEAAVRDGISSIEVIVLVRDDEGYLSLLPWHSDGKRFSPTECPNDAGCKIIAQQKLRLPSVFCQNYNVDKTINELETSNERLTGFQHSHRLKGELILILNSELKTKLLGYELSYSKDKGLTYIKEETN